MGMVEGLKRGVAVANTDMGTASDINEAASHPERWIDFGYRATHEMTRVAKGLVAAFYKVTSFRSYVAGYSAGGQQALSAAQRGSRSPRRAQPRGGWQAGTRATDLRLSCVSRVPRHRPSRYPSQAVKDPEADVIGVRE